jgi:putative tricarboxylic transport membrane protein
VLELYDGLALVPVILGLFGFSELLFLLRQQSVAQKEMSLGSEGEVLGGFLHALKYRITLIRSCIVGAIVGFIPGAGASIGTFVCYGLAKQWSREKEKFGTGHPDGLVATDSGNNAVAAGALVPLLTLGLPGSGSTTLMLAALYLHGVQPGPRLFINFQPEAYAILFSLFISAALVAIVGLPIARYFKHVAFTPTKILVTVVFVLLFVGAFAWRFVAFDILVMIFFGLVGVAMKIYNYPVSAFLLAFILGPIIEANYLRAERIGGHEIFFSSGICITLWVLCVISLLAPLFLHIRDNIGPQKKGESL